MQRTEVHGAIQMSPFGGREFWASAFRNSNVRTRYSRSTLLIWCYFDRASSL